MDPIDRIAGGQILVFEIADVRYAIPLAQVREVVRAVAIAPLPGAPAVIEGAIDYRGATVPVFDLRVRFELPASPLSPADVLIIARAGARTVALRVDRADWLRTLEPGDIDEPAALTPHLQRVAGVARLPDGLVLIHDLRTFLGEAEQRALEDALSGGSPLPDIP